MLRDPDAIVASGMGEARPEWLDQWRSYPSLLAVRNDALFFINPDHVQRPTARVLLGAGRLCRQLDTSALAHLALITPLIDRVGVYHVGTGIQGGFGGVLDDTDDKAHRHHLHRHIQRYAKQGAGQGNQQQTARRHATGAAGGQSGDHAQHQRRDKRDFYTQRIGRRQGEDGNGDGRARPY